ncbi:MAG: GW dipeptide domain-containing protein [Vagococcus sp.]|uniref:GW dipeptide domain-containing protein n=1 Tax=Vagococcus sp. TaxID=1933889 RepID=UPI002FCB3B27
MKKKKRISVLVLAMLSLGLTNVSYAEDVTELLKTPDELVSDLTQEDLEKAVGADGLGERKQEVEYGPVAPFGFKQRASFENVNAYILKNKFSNPPIVRDSRYGSTYVSNYKHNRPIGVVVHETANPGSTIEGEVNFMFNNQHNAFVHAFTDNRKVIETAPTEYLAWGAGPKANPYYMHIELVEENTFDKFARSVNNDAFWIAKQLFEWGLPVISAEKDGVGTVISHYSVSMFLGGTNHVDPIGYFAQWGYTMDEFIELINIKYNEIQRNNKQNAKVIEETDLDQTRKIVNNSYSMYTLPYNTPGSTYVKPVSAAHNVGDTVKLTKLVKTNENVKAYQIDNGLYVDYRAFQMPAEIVVDEKMNEIFKVKDAGYSIYSAPYGTEYSTYLGVLNSKVKVNDEVRVTRYVETSEKVKTYYIESIGWVNTQALRTPADIIQNQPLNQTMKVKDSGYSVYSKPYGTKGATHQGALSKYHNTNSSVNIIGYAETSEGVKVYQVKNVGWVDTRAFSEFATITSETPMNQTLQVRDGGYSVYTTPYNTPNSERKGSLNQFHKNGSHVVVSKYAETSEGVKVYYINGTGWIDTRAFSEVDQVVEQEEYTDKLFKVKDAGYSVYTEPYGTLNATRKGALSNFYKKDSVVEVTKFAKTSADVNVYYITGVGWVDIRALEELDTITRKEIYDHEMTVTIKDAGYSVYSEPYGTAGAEFKGALSKFESTGTKVVVTEYVETSANVKVYHVYGIGWVDIRAFEKELPVLENIMTEESTSIEETSEMTFETQEKITEQTEAEIHESNETQASISSAE